MQKNQILTKPRITINRTIKIIYPITLKVI